ncbi:MAG: hypothetical protein Q4D65_01990 [Peptostreptococcaceae bacterium]|nr:hypothetical protein [Peptostreptococcaceae bacterium]
MVKLHVGAPGSGKTKVMIQMANESAQTAKGEIVFVDIADKHSSMLDRKIRLVYTDEFKIDTISSLYGLLCGMVSANRDIERIYVDGLDKIVAAKIDDNIVEFCNLLEVFSKNNDLDLVFSASIEDPALLKQLEKFQ